MSAPNLTAEQHVVFEDFKVSIGKVFQSLYGDKWDEDLWSAAISEFDSRHSKADVAATLKTIAKWESWDDCKAYFQAGPPPFVREGWISPLVGQKVDLGFLNDSAAIRWVKGSHDGFRDAKAVLVVFWATWCPSSMEAVPYLAKLSSTHPNVKVIGINVEDVFGPQPSVDLEVFVKVHDEINYTIGQDLSRASIEALFKPAQRRALPTALLITPADSTVCFVGDPERADEALAKL